MQPFVFDSFLQQVKEAVSNSDEAYQSLRTKLQAALREGVTLLENVQNLESDKASLQAKVAEMEHTMSLAVRDRGDCGVLECF